MGVSRGQWRVLSKKKGGSGELFYVWGVYEGVIGLRELDSLISFGLLS